MQHTSRTAVSIRLPDVDSFPWRRLHVAASRATGLRTCCLSMARRKGTKRGREAEASAAQDVYEAEDEQPAEERPNKAKKRYDVSSAMHATLHTSSVWSFGPPCAC